MRSWNSVLGAGDAVGLFYNFKLKPLFQRRRDRFLGIDMLAGFGDLAREWQMLLIRHRQDYVLDGRISEHA